MPTLREFAQWLTTGQTASELGKSRQGVTWLAENGRLRAVKTQAGWLIDPKSVEAFGAERMANDLSAERMADEASAENMIKRAQRRG